MPVIKSAIKKLRVDRKRTRENDLFRTALARAVKNAKTQKSAKKINEATSLIDKAVKKNIIHKNKAARLKSSLSKLARPQKSAPAATANKPKTAVKSKGAKKVSKKKSAK